VITIDATVVELLCLDKVGCLSKVIMVSRVIVMTTSLCPADLSLQVGLNNISRISRYPAHDLNSQAGKQVDCPRPDASGNQDICSLLADEFRNHPGSMLIIVRVSYGVGLDYLVPFNVHNQIVRAAAEMLADLAIQSLVVITCYCYPLHIFLPPSSISFFKSG
jgi:hypothetical protein